MFVTFHLLIFTILLSYKIPLEGPWTYCAILHLSIFICICHCPRNALVLFLDLSNSIYSPRFFFYMISLRFSVPSPTWFECPFYICPWLTFTMVFILYYNLFFPTGLKPLHKKDSCVCSFFFSFSFGLFLSVVPKLTPCWCSNVGWINECVILKEKQQTQFQLRIHVFL